MVQNTVKKNSMLWTSLFKQSVGNMPASDLGQLFVSCFDVKDPDSPAFNKHGYQRNPDEARFPKIGKYYAEHKASIPPLLISVRLKYDSDIKEFMQMFEAGEYNEIKNRWNKAVMSVVDGQHRRGGLMWAVRTFEDFAPTLVPITLFFGMTFEEEAELFNTINSCQRKLPKALIEVTKGDISEREELTNPQKIRKIAFGLARDKDSPWFDQINMTGGRAPGQKVTYEGLRRSMSNMFTAEIISRIENLELDPLEDFAKPYWNKIVDMYPDAWSGITRTEIDPDTGVENEYNVPYRLKELVGVASLSRLGRDIVTSALEAHQDFGIALDKAMAKKMAPLAVVDWEKTDTNIWMASQAGFAGQSKLYGDLYKLVYEQVDPNGEAVAA